MNRKKRGRPYRIAESYVNQMPLLPRLQAA
jgi:hypothetical protein